MTNNQTVQEEKFYLQDSRSNTGTRAVFWAAGPQSGYTSKIDRAALMSREEAFGHHRSRDTDIPWPASFIQARSTSSVDCQLAKDVDGTEFEPYLVQSAVGRWDGNELVFLAKNGETTIDIEKAHRFTRDQAHAARQGEGKVWPLAYLRTLAHPTTTLINVSLKKALGVLHQDIVVRKAPRSVRPRCVGCGIFQSAGQFWSGCCPRCEADSRP